MAQDAVGDVVMQRHKTHGDYRQVAEVEQQIKLAMRASPNWKDLPDNMKSSLEQQAHKQARILCGDPTFKDHWTDIEGYARIVARHL